MVARMTIKEIARLSGVGVSTVSRVLNKRPDVNEDTRGRVMEVIERYGYEPNSNAKHLKQLSTDCVAVIVRGRNNLFFSSILELLQKRIEAAGLRFLPHYIDENDDEAAAALRVYAERKVRGIIFMGGCHTDNGAMLSRLPIPCVYSTVSAAEGYAPNVSSVSVDDRQGAKKAIDYLFDCGHENMVILSGETQGCNMAHQRYLGVLDSFKEHGKTLESSRVLVSPFSFSCAYERIVVTAASGTYEETLTAEMDKSSMPTLFQCGNEASLATWGDYCLDLKDTDVYKEMSTDDFNLFGENGEVYCIAYCYESYGLIVNKALLEKAGHQVSEITNFETLKAVAEDITARKDELGFSAFSSAGLDSSSSWRFSGHLTNLPLFYEFRDDNVTSQPATVTGKYLDNFKNIWDLYINNSTCAPSDLPSKTAGDSEAEFAQGKAVFFQNGSWEYNTLVNDLGMNKDDLTMIPIYCGVEGEEKAGLCSGTENCWAVNSKASEDDIQATLDFMYWVVTSESGTKMMADEFGPCPFKSAAEPENVFCKAAADYAAAGNYTVTWDFTYTPNVETWRDGIVAALTQYSAGTGSWDDLVNAYVNGWAVQYQNQ